MGPGWVRWADLPEGLPPSSPLLFQPDHPLMASALLQLRGDVKELYKVLFVAQVVSSPGGHRSLST